MRLNMTWDDEPSSLANSSVFYAVIPAICLPIGCIDFSINIILIAAHIRLKFWRSAPALAYFNMISVGAVSSLAASSLFIMRIVAGADHSTQSVKLFKAARILYNIELFSLGSGLLSTSLMAILRLSALALPFHFVNVAQHKYMLPLMVTSWILGSGAAFTEHHFWDHDKHKVLLYGWFVFIGLTLSLFVLALVILRPLRRHVDTVLRRTAQKLFVLAFFYMSCFVAFGLMNVFRHYVCMEKMWSDREWTVEFFCDYGNFLTVIFVFPTLNSIANAVVISRAEQIQNELKSWVNVCFCRRGTMAYTRATFNDRI
ncbi:hypothetical protein ACHWQZ_G009477 [Mnemiopsis leidyi]